MIPDFEFSSFISKYTVPPKVQHVLTSILSSKSVQDMEVKFDMTTIQKAIFGCLQVAHAQYFLLFLLTKTQYFLLNIHIDGLG